MNEPPAPMGSLRHGQSPPPHYRVWAALRGFVYFVVLAIAVPLIPRTTPPGWGAALVVSVLPAVLGTRWVYAALTGRLGRSMLEALDDDQTMGSA
jgi:hypothetical protein